MEEVKKRTDYDEAEDLDLQSRALRAFASCSLRDAPENGGVAKLDADADSASRSAECSD